MLVKMTMLISKIFKMNLTLRTVKIRPCLMLVKSMRHLPGVAQLSQKLLKNQNVVRSIKDYLMTKTKTMTTISMENTSNVVQFILSVMSGLKCPRLMMMMMDQPPAFREVISSDQLLTRKISWVNHFLQTTCSESGQQMHLMPSPQTWAMSSVAPLV